MMKNAWITVAMLGVLAQTAAWAQGQTASDQAAASGQNKGYVPFILVVDAGMPFSAEKALGKQLVSELSQFIMDVRTVSTDASLMARNVCRAYRHVAQDAAAFGFLNEYFAAARPFERAAEETVTIEVKSVLKLSDGTYRVDWTESAHERRSGKRTRAAEGWRAIITYRQNEAICGPACMYVTDVSWQKVGGS